MAVYINGSSCISPQNSFASTNFLEEVEIFHKEYLSAIEPDYKNYISPASLRRMSHILKMGVSTALCSLKEAQIDKPDAIITGTAMGCFEDTDKFLRSIGDNAEQLLTPTSFIQSTHNTVGGQVALLTKCHGYNFTYTQQEHSFEDALSDAMLYLEEHSNANVLAGGLDELNQPLFELFSRTGQINKEYGIGEGSAFFTISKKRSGACKAEIADVQTVYFGDLSQEITKFLKENGLKPDEVNVVLSDGTKDHEKLFPGAVIVNYKSLCGEYFTAPAFALWLGNKILTEKKLPKTNNQIKPTELKNLLITNSSKNRFSLILLKAC